MKPFQFPPLHLEKDDREGWGSVLRWSTQTLPALLALWLLLGAPPSVPAAPTRLAASYNHSVALHNDGTVWAWGDNSNGQLGNGTTQGSPIPVKVIGITGVISVAVGDGYSYALKSDGTVWAWGGKLPPYFYPRLTPVPVYGLRDVVSIAAGGGRVLALKSDGSVWVWSSGLYPPDPLRVQGIAGVIAVAAGSSHSMALRNDGTVWCWGRNGEGQLGLGEEVLSESKSPVMVPGLSNVTAIAAGGDKSFAIRSDGSVWAWGGGPLGDGSMLSRKSPVRVVVLSGPVAALAPSRGKTIAVLKDGTVRIWGAKTERVAFVTGITAVASGGSHFLALDKEGDIYAWGGNSAGQLGAGIPDHTIPAQVAGVSSVSAISSCSSCNYTMALKNDGTVWSWGDKGTADSFVPVQVPGLEGVSRCAAGGRHRLALKTDGTVWAWGDNENGQLGNGGVTDSDTPVQVTGLYGVTRVGAGADFSLAVKSDGTVWSWGSNANGALGNSGIQQSSIPLQVPKLSAVTDVSAGERHAMAVKKDGSVSVWGVHFFGSGFSSTPVAVEGLPAASRVAAGSSHSLAMITGGSSGSNLWSWGNNDNGALGDGAPTRWFPRSVGNLPAPVKGIAAGSSFSLALQDDGRVFSWGLNDYGQLGTGGTTSTTSAAQVQQLTGVVEVAAGNKHGVALKSDGTVWSWGGNGAGQLGRNSGSMPLRVPLNVGAQEEVPVTVTVSGTGVGSVYSFPSGIVCTAGTCTGSFLTGSRVTLRASTGSSSLFWGWGGGCSGVDDCVLEMTSGRDVTATFSVAYPLRIGDSGYNSLAAAYSAAPAGALIMSRDGDLLEGLLADRDLAVRLAGGYYANFSGRSGLPTLLRGRLLVRRGTLIVDRIKVM